MKLTFLKFLKLNISDMRFVYILTLSKLLLDSVWGHFGDIFMEINK